MSKKTKASMPMTDKDYEARSDAQTLAQAQEIKEDKARAARAVRAAKTLAQEAQKNLGKTVKGAGRKR